MTENIASLLYSFIGAIVGGSITYYFFQKRVKFSKLHEDRATVIKELHEKLIIFEDSMNSLTNPMKISGDIKEKEKLKISGEKGNDFESYYKKNKIYFDLDLCKILDEISREMKYSWTAFYVYPDEIDTISKSEASEKWKERIDAWKNITEKVLPLKNKLEEEFRRILGVMK